MQGWTVTFQGTIAGDLSVTRIKCHATNSGRWTRKNNHKRWQTKIKA